VSGGIIKPGIRFFEGSTSPNANDTAPAIVNTATNSFFEEINAFFIKYLLLLNSLIIKGGAGRHKARTFSRSSVHEKRSSAV
jgi:hypothetical protein